MHTNRLILITLMLASLAGCTQYEYVIIEPAEYAGRLTRQERAIERGPVTYHLVDQSSRVGIRIENPGPGTITIRGEESYVVTPAGQSTPLTGGSIAPFTWAAITIPPLVTVWGNGGGVGFGVGVGSWGSGGGGGVGVGYSPMDAGWGTPRDEVAWRWTDGIVRLHLALEPSDDPGARIEQDFTIERRKASK